MIQNTMPRQSKKIKSILPSITKRPTFHQHDHKASTLVNDSPTINEEQDTGNDLPTSDRIDDAQVSKFVNRIFMGTCNQDEPLSDIYDSHHWQRRFEYSQELDRDII